MKDGQSGDAYSVRGACPTDPSNVMCCVKTVKIPSVTVLGVTLINQTGRCVNVNECTGGKKILTGYCPGNEEVKLCLNY